LRLRHFRSNQLSTIPEYPSGHGHSEAQRPESHEERGTVLRPSRGLAWLPGEDRRPEETARSGTPPAPRQSEAEGHEQGVSSPGLWVALAIGEALRGALRRTRSVMRPPARVAAQSAGFHLSVEKRRIEDLDRTPLRRAFANHGSASRQHLSQLSE
jgi:hypothetical protein